MKLDPTADESAKVLIGKASVDRITFRQAVDKILSWSKHRDSHYIVTPNADHVLLLETDDFLQKVYKEASLVTCDGKPLMWASYLFGKPIPQAITGSDLLPAICKYGASQTLAVALMGGPPGAAHAAGERLAAQYPGIKIVWTYCPPLGFETDAEQSRFIESEIARTDPDVLFVGVGAPKQENWMFIHKSRIRTGVMLGVGAAIEFTAGTLPRAPKWMRRVGLEWAFRLLHDPRRLALRYFRDLRFFVIVFRQLIRK